MGLLSWFFPSPADLVARARRLMDGKRWAEARLELLGVDHPDAEALRIACETELVKLNLDAAVSWARAGDESRMVEHLELADSFHHGGLEEAFKDARKQMRDARAERTAAEQRAQEAERARLMSVDPLGVSGGPSWRDRSMPTDLLDAADDEVAARLALIVEGYAPGMRATVGGLGAPFARALLDLEDGRPDLSLQSLLELPDDQPVVRYERARAAYALGDPAAAARELKQFANLAHGHHPMGRYHSGVFLSLCLAEAGQADEGLRVLRGLRSKEPKLGGALYPQLLELTGDLPEAERSLVELIRSHPRDNGLYKMLARVRVAGGHRKQAMAALEAALSAVDCTPGRCGAQPPDLGVIRGLATLYLEDGVELQRGLELAAQARGLTQEPAWEDAYLIALAARAGRDPDAPRFAEALWSQTPPNDPRYGRLQQFLPA